MTQNKKLHLRFVPASVPMEHLIFIARLPAKEIPRARKGCLPQALRLGARGLFHLPLGRLHC